jgi:hypothetical protein
MVSCITPTRNGTVTLLMLLSLVAGGGRPPAEISLQRPWIFDQITGMGASAWNGSRSSTP